MLQTELKKSKGLLKLIGSWTILLCDDNIGEMYRSLYSLEYFYKPKIQKPLWGSHISIVRGELCVLEKLKRELNGMKIEFYYIPEMETNGCHFYLPVLCPLLDDLRNELSLNKSIVNYHLSIGNIKNDKQIS